MVMFRSRFRCQLMHDPSGSGSGCWCRIHDHIFSMRIDTEIQLDTALHADL